MAASSKRILMIVGDFVEDYEAMVPLQILQCAGHDVVTVCPIEFGTRLRGTVNEHEGDSLLVAIKLAVGHPVMDACSPDVDLVRTETLDLRTTMIVGQKKRIDCGHSKLLEIHLKPIATVGDELSGPSESR